MPTLSQNVLQIDLSLKTCLEEDPFVGGSSPTLLFIGFTKNDTESDISFSVHRSVPVRQPFVGGLDWWLWI